MWLKSEFSDVQFCIKLPRRHAGVWSSIGKYLLVSGWNRARVSVLSLEPQMVFLCLRHAGAVYHILYTAGDATPHHAFIKESLAAVALNRAFDNTVCLLMRQVLATTCEFTVCFLLPSFFFSFPFSLALPPLCPFHGSKSLFSIRTLAQKSASRQRPAGKCSCSNREQLNWYFAGFACVFK